MIQDLYTGYSEGYLDISFLNDGGEELEESPCILNAGEDDIFISFDEQQQNGRADI